MRVPGRIVGQSWSISKKTRLFGDETNVGFSRMIFRAGHVVSVGLTPKWTRMGCTGATGPGGPGRQGVPQTVEPS